MTRPGRARASVVGHAGLRAGRAWRCRRSLALGTYFSARHLLVEQRERTATRQAFTDGALVRDSLLTSGAQVSDVLGSHLAARRGRHLRPSRRRVVLVVAGQRRAGDDRRGAAGRWPTDRWASAGPTRRTRTRWSSGIPLPAVDAEYYEVSVAEELDRTLWTLGLALAVCAALTTVAGALLGRAASRRVLAPLGEVTTAAARVSAGDMTTRLTDTDDPDLAALVGSFNNMVDALARTDRSRTPDSPPTSATSCGRR